MRFADMVDDLSARLTSGYRHSVSISRGALQGKLHVPSYAREVAHGRPDHFPVIRATRVIHTPENLLVSEAIRLSLAVTRAWAHQRGAEGKAGLAVLQKLTRTEARHPWTELRNIPRPPLSTLIPVVRGRAVAGMIPLNSPILGVCDLFENRNRNAAAFDASAEALAFAATNNPRFGDRLFELLCLAWIIDGVQTACDESVLVPGALRQGSVAPILRATHHTTQLQVFFQTGRPLGPKRWRDRITMKPLAAIPDIVVKARRGDQQWFFIIDAKNRPKGSDSSVVYKLLGYRENTSVQPFLAVAIFPTADSNLTHRTLIHRPNRVTLLRLPLRSGRRIVQRLVRQVLTS